MAHYTIDKNGVLTVPDGLTVGGSLDISGTGITNSVAGCGNSSRTIIAYKNKMKKVVVSLGCFVGDEDQCIYAITKEYDGIERDDYISKVKLAFSLYR